MSGAHASSRMPMLEPEQVAVEVLAGVAAKRFEVWTPRSLGYSVRLASLAPRVVREWGLRASGTHDIVDKLDATARADYLASTFTDLLAPTHVSSPVPAGVLT